ncbi:uncharacterized protein LOC130723151 [Lotus japonicus]|uniref:uncharacterized protein LOC130723151 n=1 Tax=Lotus japonicus TaxID=34305 RepID=UPI002585E3B9|nr:uncharacterized protein LOC130723151 [Lotus japonicus]
MASEKTFENFCVRFTGKNYGAWEFQFQMFVKGKGLWDDHVAQSTAPAEKTALAAWQTKDAQVITWILASVEPHMINNLRAFSTAKDMWDYLKRIYNQDNVAKRFQLELDIANYRQGNLSIQDYYSGFLTLWADHSAILHADVSKDSLTAVQKVYQISQRDQFLMKLRPEFEAVRAALLNRNPAPSLDVCLAELLREEQRLLTLSRDDFVADPVSVAYAAQSKGKGRDMRQVQCFSCKQFGHLARNCSKKFCNYCKQQGHILADCPTRPPRKPLHALHATTTSLDQTSAPTTSSAASLTPEAVQQMVLAALSALGLQGSGVGESDRKGA